MKSMSSTSLYAAIDLGSNSFHMLVVREVAGSIQTLSRIKRKVRLAAGLNSDNTLSAEAYLPQQCLYFLPLPQGHGSLRPTFFSTCRV